MTHLPRVAHFAVAPEFVDRILLHDLRRLRAYEDITVISTEGAALEGVRRDGFRVLTVHAHRKLSPLTDIRTVVQLWRLFRRERFDLVHTYTPKAGLLGQLAALLAHVPHRIHGCRGLLYTDDLPSWKRFIFRITDRLTSGVADLTLYLSEADRGYAVTGGLCAAQRAICIGSGIDLARYVPTDDTRRAGRALREQLGFRPEHTVVLSVGRFVADKGYRETAAAVQRIRGEYPGLRCLWVAPVLSGEDGVLPASLATAHGLDAIVRVLGYTEDLLPALAAADVLLHPSYREGVPRVVMEAAAMGVPVIASDIPGCRSVLGDATDQLFSPRDAAALEVALRWALDHPEELARRADSAAIRVRARFDQEALSTRVWHIHESLLA